MTRFAEELNGMRGDFWKKEAEKELARVQADYEAGKITIDEKGIARNCIGRILMADMLEKLALVTDEVDVEATTKAYDEETHKELEAYRATKRGFTEEELIEMRATFGTGTVVTDMITGEKITL